MTTSQSLLNAQTIKFLYFKMMVRESLMDIILNYHIILDYNNYYNQL